MTKARDHFIPY